MKSVYLKSIDKKLNRDRIYSIQLDDQKKSKVIVYQGWGRGSSIKRIKRSEFDKIDLAEKYVISLLIKRKNHGYTMSYVSNNFPVQELINSFSKSMKSTVQLSLYSS